MKIVEERLASELGVSRIPLREALHKLERDGFVESLAHRGFRVAAFSADDVRQIYEIREMLEIPAAVKAVKGMNEALFQKLDECLNAMRESVSSGEPISLVTHHVAFHQTIYGAGDNPRLADLLGPFMELGFTFRVARHAGVDGWNTFLDEHQRIIDVLRQGDPEVVASAMRDHLVRGRETSLSLVSS